jgi:hypothetical protein
MIAATTMSPLSCQMLRIGAPEPIASMARLNSQGMTLVIAADASTIRSPDVNGIQYGL